MLCFASVCCLSAKQLQRLSTNFDEIFLELGCTTKTFDFGADRDHDPDPGIFNGIFTIVGWGQL